MKTLKWVKVIDMNKYIEINDKREWFDLDTDKQSVVFGHCGFIMGSAILRMNKSRYKVYIIWSYSATDMVFNGIGAAMDWLQKQYDNE